MTAHSTIDEYIAAQTPETAKRLSDIRKLLHTLIPETKESISYQIPAFTVGSHKLFFSAYKNHIGMYPMYGIPELEDDLAKYRGAGTKDSLHFKHTEPIPMDLIEKIVIAKNSK